MLPGSICREDIPAPFSWQEVSLSFSVETCVTLCKNRAVYATLWPSLAAASTPSKQLMTARRGLFFALLSCTCPRPRCVADHARSSNERDLAIVQFKINRDHQAELIVDAGLRNTQIQNHRAVRSGFE